MSGDEFMKRAAGARPAEILVLCDVCCVLCLGAVWCGAVVGAAVWCVGAVCCCVLLCGEVKCGVSVCLVFINHPCPKMGAAASGSHEVVA